MKLVTQDGVSHITNDDFEELIRLHEEYLNYGDGIRPHFEEILSNPDNIALKYVVDGIFAGLIIYTKGIELSGSHADIIEKLNQLSNGEKTYTGDAVLIKSEYRSLRIADKLYRAAIDELKKKGVKYIVHELWVLPDGRVPAKRMCENYTNNIFVGRFDNFYRNFHHFGYICPICNNDCMCSADIYLTQI
jgi:ribosomal protein S18 acetylase RimI-like enzyme